MNPMMSPMRLNATADELLPELRSVQGRLLRAGGVGAAICAIGLLLIRPSFSDPTWRLISWRLGVTLGCLALAMVHQVSGGAWGVVIWRVPRGGDAHDSSADLALRADRARHVPASIRGRIRTSSRTMRSCNGNART